MTDSTRTDILNRIALRANDAGDIGLMRLYLSIYPSRDDYERAARNHIEFFAVLATEEFHRVWEERSKSDLLPHTHVALYRNGVLTGECAECGWDIRCFIHAAPEGK